MGNVFDEQSHHIFSWNKLGNIKEGRSNLGDDVPVVVYRLMQYTMNHILAQEYGVEKADEIFRKSGYLAGCEFTKNVLVLEDDFDGFVANLQKTLKDLKIGILRIEEVSDKCDHIVLTVAQDLDCSGLEMSDEVICKYDEGFLEGILETYTGHPYYAREIDCWSNGARVCRFRCVLKDE